MLPLFIYSCLSTESDSLVPEPLKIAYNAILLDSDTINYEVFLMDADGGNQQNLSKHPAVDWVYHAVGKHLYLISDRDTLGGVYHLYSLDLETDRLKKVLAKPVADSWIDSRYGGSQLVICHHSGPYQSISIIDSSGAEIRELIRTNQYNISDPVFSPEGNWIVYRSTRSGQDELWIVDEYGAYQRQITVYEHEMQGERTL